MSVRLRHWKNDDGRKAVWVCDFRGLDGRRHLRTFQSKGDAETYHAFAAIVRVSRDLNNDPVINALALRLVQAIVEIGNRGK